MKKYYIDKRVLVNGRESNLFLDNFLGFNQIVNSIVTGGSSALPFVFRNGITETSGNVELGGDLIKDTTINADSFNLLITGTDDHLFLDNIITATRDSKLQHDQFQIALTNNNILNSENATISVNDNIGNLEITLSLTSASGNTVSFVFKQDGGDGNPSVLVEGLNFYTDEAAADTAGLLENMLYITTGTRALTVKGPSGF